MGSVFIYSHSHLDHCMMGGGSTRRLGFEKSWVAPTFLMAMGAIGLGPKGKRLETTRERSWAHVNLVRVFFFLIFLLSASLNLDPQISKMLIYQGGFVY